MVKIESHEDFAKQVRVSELVIRGFAGGAMLVGATAIIALNLGYAYGLPLTLSVLGGTAVLGALIGWIGGSLNWIR